jgi:hypothetical protein
VRLPLWDGDVEKRGGKMDIEKNEKEKKDKKIKKTKVEKEIKK